MHLLSALSVAVVLAVAYAQQCSKHEYSLNTRDYLNELGVLVENVYRKIKFQRMDYLREINTNITRGYQRGRCQQSWDASYTSADRNRWLYQYLKTFRDDEGRPTPPHILELAEAIERYLWRVGQDDVFTTCIFSKIRDSIMTWLTEDCLNGKVDFVKQGLNDFPVPQYYDNSGYEKDLRAAVVLMATAYLESTKCGGQKVIQNVIREMNQQTEEDFCWAASDTYISDICYDTYKDRCPEVIGCFHNLVENFDNGMAEKVFGSQGKVIRDVADCNRKSRAYWGSTKPSGMISGTDIIKEGLSLWNKIKKTEKEMSRREKEKSKMYWKTVMKAHFRTEACDCENTGR